MKTQNQDKAPRRRIRHEFTKKLLANPSGESSVTQTGEPPTGFEAQDKVAAETGTAIGLLRNISLRHFQKGEKTDSDALNTIAEAGKMFKAAFDSGKLKFTNDSSGLIADEFVLLLYQGLEKLK